jgi:hypothetical protein
LDTCPPSIDLMFLISNPTYLPLLAPLSEISE